MGEIWSGKGRDTMEAAQGLLPTVVRAISTCAAALRWRPSTFRASPQRSVRHSSGPTHCAGLRHKVREISRDLNETQRGL